MTKEKIFSIKVTKQFISNIKELGIEINSKLFTFNFNKENIDDIDIRSKIELDGKKIVSWNTIASESMEKRNTNSFVIIFDAIQKKEKKMIFIYYIDKVFHAIKADFDTEELEDIDLSELMPHMIYYDYENKTDNIVIH